MKYGLGACVAEIELDTYCNDDVTGMPLILIDNLDDIYGDKESVDLTDATNEGADM